MPFEPPARIYAFLREHRNSIRNAINDVVRSKLQHALQVNQGKADEVRMLYSFFYLGLPELEEWLDSIARGSGLRISIAGILCHKSPIVVFTEPNSGACELADITFLVTYSSSSSKAGLGNALLAQTKLELKEAGHNPNQEMLYQSVLDCKYASSAYSHASRRLPPKSTPALSYWVFNASGLCAHGYGYYSERTELFHPLAMKEGDDHGIDLGAGLCDLMEGRNGRGFKQPTGEDQGWDQIIFDLLRVTCGKTVTLKNIHAKDLKGLRGGTANAAIAKLLGKDCHLVKNSFSEIFSSFGDAGLEKLGKQIEESTNRYSSNELVSTGAEYEYNLPPPPEPGGDPDREHAGGSFLIIHIREESKAIQWLRKLSPFNPWVSGSLFVLGVLMILRESLGMLSNWLIFLLKK